MTKTAERKLIDEKDKQLNDYILLLEVSQPAYSYFPPVIGMQQIYLKSTWTGPDNVHECYYPINYFFVRMKVSKFTI